MRRLLASVLYCLTILGSQPSDADVLIPVPPVPGSIITVAFDINDDDVITGYFVDASGHAHSFYGTLDGNYTIFDDSAGLAIPVTINIAGYIAGETIVTDQSTCDVVPFERSPDGTIVHVKKGKSSLTGIAAGLNAKGEFVGYYCNESGGASAYYGRNGKYKSPLTISGNPLATIVGGINKSGVVAGYFSNGFGQASGFVLHDGVTDVIFYPGATATELGDVNDHGFAAGTWMDAQSMPHAFVVDTSTQTFTPIDYFEEVRASGMNNQGLVVLNHDAYYLSYVFCPRSKRKCPGNGVEAAHGKTLSVPVPAGAIRRGAPAGLPQPFLPSMFLHH